MLGSFDASEYPFIFVRSSLISVEGQLLDYADYAPVLYVASTKFRRRSALFDSPSTVSSAPFFTIVTTGAMKY